MEILVIILLLAACTALAVAGALRTRRIRVGSPCCSEVGAASNGQWFGTLTAYDVAGNEGVPIQVIPFELVGFPEPGPLSQVVEPAEIGLIRHLVGFDILAVELTWTSQGRKRDERVPLGTGGRAR